MAVHKAISITHIITTTKKAMGTITATKKAMGTTTSTITSTTGV